MAGGGESCLMVVDLQVDFCPGGALPVPHGDEVVPVVNGLVDLFERRGLPVVFSRDWHPKDHVSFRDRGGPWPSHCVAGTPGASFHPKLKVPEGAVVVSKATARDEESYSAFGGTDLEQTLRSMGTKRLFVAGLALDFCVKATALDGVKLGFKVFLVEDATRPVFQENAKPTLEELRNAGVEVISSGDVEALL